MIRAEMTTEKKKTRENEKRWAKKKKASGKLETRVAAAGRFSYYQNKRPGTKIESGVMCK